MTGSFRARIQEILKNKFEGDATEIENLPLVHYLIKKTKGANRGSKSRGSFGNLYAVLVLVQDYLRVSKNENYAAYQGALFGDLLSRCRALPYGKLIQNHSLNSRVNEEFRGQFPNSGLIIERNKHRYRVNERLLNITLSSGQTVDIGQVVVDIIHSYVDARATIYQEFLCIDQHENPLGYIENLLDARTEARLFEIAVFGILKVHYAQRRIRFQESGVWVEETLALYKIGRTNANDRGIDFIMKPLGKIFQVTEVDTKEKFLLDIDKIGGFPITFVVRSERSPTTFLEETFSSVAGNPNLELIEEVITLPILRSIMSGFTEAMITEAATVIKDRAHYEFQTR